MKPPTARQLEYLNSLHRYIKRQGYPPTMRELAHTMGVTIRGVHEMYKALSSRGLIIKHGKKVRAVLVTPLGHTYLPEGQRKPRPPKVVRVPLLNLPFRGDHKEGLRHG